MSIVRDSAWKSSNWQFYKSFHKLRETYLLPWDRLIQSYGLRHTMLLGQELELPFLPNMASLIPPRLLLQILLCAQCSGCSFKHTPSCFKCGGGHTISHCPRLDQGQSQAQLMNPKILPTPANAVKLARYLEGYESVLSHKIVSGFVQGFELDYTGERKSLLAPNLESANEFPEVIDSKIQSEVASGRIVGPFNTPPPPLDPLWVSPVGEVPQTF